LALTIGGTLIKQETRRRGRRFVAAVGVALAATLATTAAAQPAQATPQAKTTTISTAAKAAPTTKFGATVWVHKGETYKQALARADKTYSRMDVTRVFYGGAPAAWPGTAGLSGRHVVVSFKFHPANVIAKKHDAQMLQWFKTAPRDRDIDWIYFHEPENDIERGDFTAAQFRAAFAHLSKLADQAKNPRLKANLNLMCWTYSPSSKRSWKNYYPGSAAVDVMAFDCYNSAANTTTRYDDPAKIFGPAIANARSLKKPFAIAETGSRVVVGDTGAKRRAVWLDKTATYLRAQNARYVTLFDAPVGGEYRLLDAGSQAVWRKHVAKL
jgi:hypothetical protein